MKYPFVRVETRFKMVGTNEVILSHAEMAADHVSVELMPSVTEEQVVAAITPGGGTLRKKLNLEYAETYLIGLPQPTLDAVPEAIAWLGAFTNLFTAVDSDGISHKTSFFPNDPRFHQLWHLHNTGQSSGLRDADIDATEAWVIHQGSPNVIVAISDTGLDYRHPDLKDNVWINTAERATRADTDRNSYVDDILGWNFVNGNTNVMDIDGHGTFVAGIIGARGNNGIGISGVAWQCKLMPLKVLDTDGGYASDIAEGFDYARRMGAKIINASHGGPGSAVVRTAVNNLHAAGVLLIAAAGNESANTDITPMFPACYTNQNVISVAATGRGDLMGSFSSYGAKSVH
ncbi:MAG: S8 family peptidase, partial [Limisphaerales bacterium]